MTSHHVCICNIKKKQLTVCFHIFILCLKGERFIIYAVLLSLLLSIVFFVVVVVENNSTKPESESDCRMNTELFVPPSGL